jgi:hypothetical protein
MRPRRRLVTGSARGDDRAPSFVGAGKHLDHSGSRVAALPGAASRFGLSVDRVRHTSSWRARTRPTRTGPRQRGTSGAAGQRACPSTCSRVTRCDGAQRKDAPLRRPRTVVPDDDRLGPGRSAGSCGMDGADHVPVPQLQAHAHADDTRGRAARTAIPAGGHGDVNLVDAGYHVDIAASVHSLPVHDHDPGRAQHMRCRPRTLCEGNHHADQVVFGLAQLPQLK